MITEGSVIEVKNESDGDVHIVLMGESGATIVAEFPDPNCVANPAAREPIGRAREQLVEILQRPAQQVSTHDLYAPIYVRLRGLAFWDKSHRQVGESINGLEIHPALAVERTDPPR